MLDSKKIFKWVMVLMGALILFFLIRSIELEELKSMVEVITLQKLAVIILIAVGIIFFNILLKAYRWKILVQKVSGRDTPLWFSFNSILAGVAASSFIPGRVEIAKPALLKAEYNVPLGQSFSSLIIERALDLLTLLLIPAVALLFFTQNSFINPWIILVIVAFLAGISLLLIFFPRSFLNFSAFFLHIRIIPRWFQHKALSFIEQLILGFAIFKSKQTVLLLFLLSFIANGLEVLRFFVIARFLGIEVSFGLTGLIFTSSLLVGILSAIPGGLGATELSAVALFSLLLPDINSMPIKSAVLLDRIVSFYLLVLIGAVLLLFYKKAFK